MALDDSPADGQAKTGAFGLVDPGRWYGGKLIKNGFKIFLLNTHPPVFDRYGHIGGIFFHSYLNCGSGIGKFDGILN